MKKSRLLLLCLSVTICLCCMPFAAFCEAPSDPVVVQVGERSYRLSEVQAYWDSLAAMAAASGVTIEESELPLYRQAVVDSYVSMGVLENQYTALGLDQLTPAEMQALEADAQKIYREAKDAYTRNIAQQYGRTEEDAASYAETFMELDRYTMDSARGQALRTLTEQRMLNYVAADVAVPTEDELQAYYDTNFVEPSRAAYAEDIEAFENDVLYLGGECYYIPEGYRYVRHIFLPAGEEIKQRAATLQAQLTEANAALETAGNKVYGYELLEKDATEALREQKTAQGECDRLTAELQAVYGETLTLRKDTLAQIDSRLSAGEDFAAVTAAYSQDDVMPEEGFMLSARSVLWETNFITGAMALQKPGDLSQPIVTPAGVHIIEYTSDAPSGPVPLSGALREQVAQLLLTEKKYDVLGAFIEARKADYQIVTRPELLVTPTIL